MVVVVPDWPGSEVDSIMIQASGKVELKGISRVSFKSKLLYSVLYCEPGFGEIY